ncbi:MAG: MBL fold metallo-hydrolase [Firmicutes bacterium]|nr:MBL fold metallo-hydrolase [Bacillota bacterium]
MKKTGKKKTYIAVIAIILAAACIAAIFIYHRLHKNEGIVLPRAVTEEDLLFFVFDQGQGQSVFISMGDMQILIDGGPYVNGGSLPEKMRPYVPDGIIEYVIATHCHEDHVGGLQYVYEAFDVEHTIYGDRAEDQGYFWYFENAVNVDGGTYEEDSDMTIALENGATLEIYDIEDGNENSNDNSVVTYLKYGKTSFLSMGDLEWDMEERLLEYDLEPTVMVAAHHGSYTSNSILEELKPGFFIISAGKKNENNQPHRSVLWNAVKYTKGKNVYGTWRSGDIVFISNGRGVSTNLSRWDRLTVDDAGAIR